MSDSARLFLVAVALTGCPRQPAHAPPCGGADPLSASALLETVAALASPDLGGRWPGSAGDRGARKLIEDRFRCLELEPAESGFSQSFQDDEGNATANVIGVLPGASDEVIVIGAHHDHLGQDEAGVYAGANDDASGVAVLLGVAAELARRGETPRRTLVFAAFGAEEAGYLGSQWYAEHLPPGLENTVYMINLDMVGVYDQTETLYALHTFEGTPARDILEDLESDFPELNLVLGEPGEEADHLTFCEAGVPVAFFWTPDEECYHQTCDTADRIDSEGMAAIARLTVALVDGLDAHPDLASSGCQAP